MSDEKQKVRDMIRKALDERTPEQERIVTAFKALAWIVKYDLIPDDDVTARRAGRAASFIDMATDPNLVDNVVARAEKMANGFVRLTDIARKITGVAEGRGDRGDGGGRGEGGRRRRRNSR
jgi:hypothetical protein